MSPLWLLLGSEQSFFGRGCDIPAGLSVEIDNSTIFNGTTSSINWLIYPRLFTRTVFGQVSPVKLGSAGCAEEMMDQTYEDVLEREGRPLEFADLVTWIQAGFLTVFFLFYLVCLVFGVGGSSVHAKSGSSVHAKRVSSVHAKHVSCSWRVPCS